MTTVYMPSRKLELINDLGICGCGSPEIVYEEVYNTLKRAANENECVIEDIDNVDPHMLFMVYTLNDKGYLNHGSSVYSSFITEDGKELLEALEKFKKYSFDYDEATSFEYDYFYTLESEDCSE